MSRAIPLLLLIIASASACADDPEPRDAGPTPDASDLDAASADADTSLTPCGPSLECDRTLDVCVIRGPVGPGFTYTCEPVPNGCDLDRTCDCIAFTYCVDAFDTCTDGDDNTITCECPNCQ